MDRNLDVVLKGHNFIQAEKVQRMSDPRFELGRFSNGSFITMPFWKSMPSRLKRKTNTSQNHPIWEKSEKKTGSSIIRCCWSNYTYNSWWDEILCEFHWQLFTFYTNLFDENYEWSFWKICGVWSSSQCEISDANFKIPLW